MKGSVGFLPLLALLFIGLKLGGIISWSWWWVLSPLWGPVALIFALIPVAAIIFISVVFISHMNGSK